jgi:hypothetical protein
MNLVPLIGFFGWCAAVLVGSALMNYILKAVNKRFISPRKDLKPDLVKRYRVFMQLIVKNHRTFGIAALVVFFVHLVVSYFSSVLSITGSITGIVLMGVVSLGIYGFHINRNLKGKWVLVHRLTAFILLASLGLHVAIKAYVYL